MNEKQKPLEQKPKLVQQPCNNCATTVPKHKTKERETKVSARACRSSKSNCLCRWLYIRKVAIAIQVYFRNKVSLNECNLASNNTKI